MFDQDLTKLKRADLEAILDTYRANPIDGTDMAIAANDALANKEAVVAEIDRLRSTVGYAHTVTEEDMRINPELANDGIKEGEVVYLSQEEVDEKTRLEGEAAATAKLEADKAAQQKEADEKAAEDAKAKAAAEAAPASHDPIGPPEPTLPDPTAQDLVYRGKTVVRLANKLVHGVSYVEVDCASETYTLSKEEFARDVHPRNG